MITLEQEFERAKFNIQLNNYAGIIKELKKYFIDLEEAQTGLLLTDSEATERAHNAFCTAKKAGILDELNLVRSK